MEESKTSVGKKRFACSVCDYKTHYKRCLTEHTRIHTGDRPFSCTYSGCSYSSANKSNLMRHLVLKHSKEKPYCCQLCGKRFQNKQFLNSHVRNHKGKRPICCQYKGCEFSCTSSSNLKRHILIHTKEKPHHCYFEGCGFSCNRGNTLKRHIRTHTGERPYHCTFKNCNFSCIDSSSLNPHLLTHTKDKPYHCNFNGCKFSSAQSVHLKLHMMRHATQSPHACPKCKFRSRTSLEIEQHLETHHKLQDASNSGQLLPNGLIHHVKSHLEFRPISSSNTQTQPSLLLEPPATNSNLNTNRNRKTSLPKPGIQKEEESSVGVEGIEAISQTNAHSSGVKNDSPQSVSQVKAMPWKKYSCPICEFGTKRKSKYEDHVKLHQQEGHLFCSLCDFVSLKGKLFKKHLRSHRNILLANIPNVQLSNKDIPLDLDVSPVSLNSLSVTRSDSDEIAVDDSAVAKLSEFDGTSSKKNGKENLDIKKTFMCSVCDFKAQFKSSLTLHSQIHTGDRNFLCTYSGCNHSSRRKEGLIRHLLLRHSDEKPYCCQLCGERFRNRQFLNSHIRDHKGKRPICCQYKGCEFSCTNSSDLKRHILTHTGEKPYYCDVEDCGFSCNRNSVLKRHIGAHSGYRPYRCTFTGCSHSSRDAGNLKTHVLTHTGAKPFHCDFHNCQFSAAHSSNLKTHMMRHLTQNPHACPQCKFRSRTPLEIKQHLEIHHKLQNTSKLKFERKKESSGGVEVIEAISSTQAQLVGVNNDLPQFVSQVKLKPRKMYSCPICELGTKKKSKYKEHIELHQKEGYLFCTLCDFASVNRKNFKKHLCTHENDPCDSNNNSEIQNNSYSKVPLIRQETLLDTSPSFLNSHSLPLSDEVDADESGTGMQPPEYGSKLLKMKDKETSDEKKCFCCSVCDFKTQYKRNLARHVKIHTEDKPFLCTFSGCNYSSRQKSGLVLHFLSGHSKEKPYLCKLCGEAFKTKHLLNSHVINHTGRRPYCCLYNGCEYSSNRASHLKEHILTHTGDKPHHCYFEGCGYSCTTISSLNAHIRTHTGERPYACHFKDCNYFASNTRNLKNHISTHTGAKPFRCDFNDCKFSCSQSGHLKEHMLLHLSKNPHTCPECKFRYRTPLEIEQHLENHHTLHITSKSRHLQPNAPIRESLAEAITNILRAQAQPSLSSQYNNETQDAARPRKKYVCTICDFESKSKRKYNAHLDSHGQKNTNATVEVSFTSPNGVSNENSSQTEYDSKLPTMEEKQTSDEQKCFKSSVCDYKTQCKHHLTDHARIHTGDRPFSCTYSGCNYSAAQKGNVMTHFVLIHSKEMPYACQLCGEAFRNRQFLNSHVRNHKGKRPICCQYKGCEFSSFLSYDLKRHIRTHTLEKPHHCDFEDCDFSCSRKFTLKAHLLTHTGGRPYRCTFKNCNFSAIHSSNLKTHSFIHTKVKPFRCDFSDCEFSCAQSGHLKLHIMQHLSQTPHACPHCKFRSRTLLEIEQHLETHHKLQNTSPSWGQPDAKIRESPAEAITNIMREQIQPPFISQNNNEKDFITRDEARPSKKYVCLRCDFESKSHKKYKAHLNSQLKKKQFLETRDTKLAKRKINSKQGSNIYSNRSQGKENGIALLRETKKSLASFPCNFCKKSFAKEMKLLNHLRYHTGQKMPRIESHD